MNCLACVYIVVLLSLGIVKYSYNIAFVLKKYIFLNFSCVACYKNIPNIAYVVRLRLNKGLLTVSKRQRKRNIYYLHEILQINLVLFRRRAKFLCG